MNIVQLSVDPSVEKVLELSPAQLILSPSHPLVNRPSLSLILLAFL
jgi:hypothetical protein